MPEGATVIEEHCGSPAAISTWKPRWIVHAGHGCEVGVSFDDGCLVVLCQNIAEQWRPVTHIPKEAARLIGKVVSDPELSHLFKN